MLTALLFRYNRKQLKQLISYFQQSWEKLYVGGCCTVQSPGLRTYCYFADIHLFLILIILFSKIRLRWCPILCIAILI
jgi:hypothetical protein